ncbi:MAG: SdrD B-like domain-containing protein [Microbacterium sp.]
MFTFGSHKTKKSALGGGQRIVSGGAVALLVASSFVASAATSAVAAVGDTVTGTIWQDYDSNGVMDAYESGIAGVEVRAYDSDGNVAGPVTTGADGTYSLPVTTAAAQWRVEANLPATAQWSQWRESQVDRTGAATETNGTSAQFVSVPAANVDFSFHVPDAFIENNPKVFLPAYRFGASDGAEGDLFGGTVVEYEAETDLGSGGTDYDPVPQTAQVPYEQIGATNGAAWQRSVAPGGVGQIFAAASMRRFAGLGPEGLGAIYKVTPDGSDWSAATATGALYVDLTDYGIDVGTEYDAGATATADGIRPRVTADNPNYDWTMDAQAWSRVGRVGLGGLSFSADERYLFTVNLYNRSLVRIETGKPAGTAPNAVQEFDLDSYFPDTSDVRPWGVSVDPTTGVMYITATNTAEQSKDRADLHGYVYSFDPDNPGVLTEVLSFPLDFERTEVRTTPVAYEDADFNFWTTDTADVANRNVHPTPLVTDVRILKGELIIGVRDIWGDLIGGRTKFAPGDTRLSSVRSSGDVYKATPNGDGTFTLESNGVAAGVTGAGATASPVGPDGDTGLKGPDGLKFFDDSWIAGTSPGTTGWKYTGQVLGSIVTVASREDGILSTGIHVGGGAQQVGVRRLYQATGEYYEPNGAVVIQNGGSEPSVTAKGNGLGSAAALASAAPIEIGNYVWYDTDLDGVQDPNESPVPGATVNLYEVAQDGARTLVATTTTSSTGEYYFSSNDSDYQLKTLTDYVVGIDNPADYASGGPLYGWTPTMPLTGEGQDITRNDSNGIAEEQGVLLIPYAQVTTGGAGENNHSIDFGFNQVDYEFDKRTVSGPTESPDEDGTWAIVYELVVTNPSLADGAYNLTDDLTGYGTGIEIVDTEIVSGPDGADLNEDWDGVGDKRVITSEFPIAAGTVGDDAHVYRISVTVRLDSDPDSGEAVVDPTQLECGADQQPGDDDTTGLFNVATLDPRGHEDLVDDECGELPLIELDKTIESGPTPVDGESGLWEIVYGLEVTNLTGVATEYDLDDQLQFGSGIEIVSVEASAITPADADVNSDFDGVDDTEVVRDVSIDADAVHSYEVAVTFRADLPNPASQPNPADCTLVDGDEDGTGLLNGGVTHMNGYPSVDNVCAELGQPTHTKELVSAVPIGNGQWQVDYRITVSNLGVAETSYDLDDTLRYADDVTVANTEVVTVPAGVVANTGWDGSTDSRIASDVPLLGSDDAGYTPHVYELRVIADVPLFFEDAGTDADPTECAASGAGLPGASALTNTSQLTDPADRTEDDWACAPLPSIAIDKTVSAGPIDNGDGTWSVLYDLVVTNNGAAAGVYDLVDAFEPDGDLDVVSAEVATAPDGVTTNPGWTGQGADDAAENVISSGVSLDADAVHTYQVEVVVAVEDAPGGLGVISCDALGGDDQPNGLVNAAQVGHNDLDADDQACISVAVAMPELDKKLVSAQAIGGGLWDVVYTLTVASTGLVSTSYDLDDEFRFADTVAVQSVTVTGPEGVEVNEGFNGVSDQRIATDVVIPGLESDGYAPHVYTVSVRTKVPSTTPTAAADGTGSAQCTRPEGGNDLRQGFNNVATLTDSAGDSHKDTACAPFVPGLSETGGAIPALAIGAGVVLLIGGGIAFLVSRRRREDVDTLIG